MDPITYYRQSLQESGEFLRKVVQWDRALNGVVEVGAIYVGDSDTTSDPEALSRINSPTRLPIAIDVQYDVIIKYIHRQFFTLGFNAIQFVGIRLAGSLLFILTI